MSFCSVCHSVLSMISHIWHQNQHDSFSLIHKFYKYQTPEILYFSTNNHEVISLRQAFGPYALLNTTSVQSQLVWFAQRLHRLEAIQLLMVIWTVRSTYWLLREWIYQLKPFIKFYPKNATKYYTKTIHSNNFVTREKVAHKMPSR